MTALVGLGVGHFWAFGVESWILRNEHVAFRAFLIPIIRHSWIGFFALPAWSALVAGLRFSTAPLRRIVHSYAISIRTSTR